LHERPEDIPLLARHFLQKSAQELKVEAKVLSEGALSALMRFQFPGNVRQLENICHWLTVMAPGQVIEAGDLPPEVQVTHASGNLAAGADWHQALDHALAEALAGGERGAGNRLEKEFERVLIKRALLHTTGRRIEAASWLGWGRNTLTRKIQEQGMDDEV
jgi:two-component system nitrogen regulation response regulator GlnG